MSVFEKLGKLAFVGTLGFTIYVGIVMGSVSNEKMIYMGNINDAPVSVYYQGRRFADDTYRIGTFGESGVEIKSPALIKGDLHFDNGDNLIINGMAATIIKTDGSKELIDPKKWDAVVDKYSLY
ncbi:MAG: hypothetical protein NT129_01250 [Candidatus Aenigmarchaeota archaeon]|nr:hypothetical protein [Candidatus Aenigmarchaeota archaeon]